MITLDTFGNADVGPSDICGGNGKCSPLKTCDCYQATLQHKRLQRRKTLACLVALALAIASMMPDTPTKRGIVAGAEVIGWFIADVRTSIEDQDEQSALKSTRDAEVNQRSVVLAGISARVGRWQESCRMIRGAHSDDELLAMIQPPFVKDLWKDLEKNDPMAIPVGQPAFGYPRFGFGRARGVTLFRRR